MENLYYERINSVRNYMKSRKWDALVITGSDPHNSEYPASRWKQVKWCSGFSGEAGTLVITQDHAGLWTDSRYFIEAERVLEGTGIELHKTRVADEIPIPIWLAEYAFPDMDSHVVIAVDGLCHTVSSVNEITSALEKSGRFPGYEEGCYTIVNVPDVLDAFWEDRPLVPQSPIITLSTEIVGESREDKILWLRNFLIDNKVDAILLTALDEIAWILNVRGEDVEYNPVVISYLLVTMDDVKWYVKKNMFNRQDDETVHSFQELRKEGIEILPYDDVIIDLASMASEDDSSRLHVDNSNLNYTIYKSLSENFGAHRLVSGTSPVQLRKAVKNDVEIQGMRDAHLEDGIAMEKFLYWLEKQLEMGEIVSERDAADKLGEIRKGIKGYRGDSFETISAYGASAALPHYVTPQFDAPLLRREGLYLNDSGGQFIFGTTDITRTVPLGRCSDLEKEDYTLVLRGHINLARAVFPKGTAGCHIDLLARNPLWQVKRNFGHGTGHGIGFFLNVHEGPQDIRQSFNRTPLLPGMIVSDEPGIYREGRFGIRHESLLLCKDAGRNDFGNWLCFEVLTLCHIDTSPILKNLMNKDEIDWLNDYNKRVFETLSPHLPKNIALWLEEKTRTV